MHRLTGILILLFMLLTFSYPGRAGSRPVVLANDNASLTQDRLVVFEAFMRST